MLLGYSGALEPRWLKEPQNILKTAAFMALVRLYQSAGICDENLEKAMWKMMEG